MAGGKGTRLKPLTCSLPKPMVPIINRPVMEYTVDLLKEHGITEIGVTLAYMPTMITDYFGSGKDWGVNLHYFIEETPLGTGGSVKNAEEFIDDTLLIVSGDALTDLDIQKALAFHREKGSKATLVLRNEAVPIEYGVVITDEAGKIIRFLEKPSWGEVFSNTINTGIYILEPEVLDYFSKGDTFDFSKDLFPRLLNDQVPMYGYVMNEYWCDIGDLSSYKETHFDILAGKVKLPLIQKELEEGVYVGEGTTIGKNVKLQPPVYIGKNGSIEDGAEITGPTVIGENCRISQGATIKKSILWNQVNLEEKASLRGTVICGGADIREQAKVLENSVVGEGTILLKGAVVKPDIKIWPHKRIEENTVVSQNLVWGSKASKTLFGLRDISGQINIELTPEFCARLGSAFASSLKGEPSIVISSDPSNGAQLIQQALLAGVSSTGVQGINLKGAFLPMTRFAVRYFKAAGGIHVKASSEKPDNIRLEFIDADGGNIPRSMEREIENLFNREDFKRCNADRLKKEIEVDSFHAIFNQAGINEVKHLQQIRQANQRVWLTSPSLSVLESTRGYLKGLGVSVTLIYPEQGFNSQSTTALAAALAERVKGDPDSIGFLIGESGEELMLVDENGRLMEGEKYHLLAARLLLQRGDRQLVVPYVSSRHLEELAEQFGAKIVKCKSNPASHMKDVLKESQGENLPLQFTLWYNGIWAIGKILDFLMQEGIKLRELADQIPDPFVVKQEIQCDWKDKGRVMKEMILNHQKEGIELFEGVRIDDEKGWALILPDPEKPLVNVFTEGHSQEYAEELSTFYSEKIRNLVSRH